MHWEGTWELIPDSQASLLNMRRTTSTGSSLNLVFQGTDLDLLVHRDSRSGEIQVSIDGQPQESVTLRGEGAGYSVRISLARRLPNGRHTVEITALNSPGSHVDIDGLVVQNRPVPWAVYGFGAALAVAVALLVLSHRRNSSSRLAAL